MKKVVLLFLLVTTYAHTHSQQLVSYNLIASYSEQQIDSIYTANGIPGIILPSTYGVNVYKVIYNTLDADSIPTIASGALFIPVNPSCYVSLASYQHGTILDKEDVPSRLAGLEVVIGLSMAADGYVLTMPDYIGLGDSPGLHPYVHAATEARSVADMLVAALEICDDLDITRNGQLFLLGYSQGGHATMAAHQLIQEHYGNYFTVTAAAPMSGPYDLSGVQAEVISSGGVYPNPGYLPYLLFSYNEVYHIYENVSDYLISPYDTLLPPLFDGAHSMDDVNGLMPAVPSEIIVPAVLDSFNNDPNYKLHGYLKQNDTYNWLPAAVMRMYYCEGDMDVNYQNAFVAYDSFTAYGASGISMQSSGATLDHSGCAFPSLLTAKFWFDSLRLDKLKLAFNMVFESYSSAGDGSLTVQVSGGFPPYTYLWNTGGTDSVITGLTTGLYSVTVIDTTGCPAAASIYLPVQVGIDEIFAPQISIYPNPFHSVASVEFGVAGDYHLTLSDISGKTLWTEPCLEKQFRLERNHLSSGIYLLSVSNKEGATVFKKLMIE